MNITKLPIVMIKLEHKSQLGESERVSEKGKQVVIDVPFNPQRHISKSYIMYSDRGKR
jgi:hypothetical protein